MILSIKEFVDEIEHLSKQKLTSIKIGIVQKDSKVIQGMEGLGCVAIARDIHAIALLSQDNLHAHTIIAIMYEDGLRSCVVHRGRILCSEEGNSLGDLSSMSDIDIYQGIGILLCMFGPAVVILTGENFGDNVNSLIGKIRPYVPQTVWENSIIRESVFKSGAAVQAAAKLHYLHYKYKFSM
jgi:hypothetical protein